MDDDVKCATHDTDEVVTLPYEVRQSGTVPVIEQVPAYAWRCGECGWLGTGLYSESAAKKEAAEHAWLEHRAIPCREDQFGDPHVFVHVPGTDSLSECARCKWVIGK